MRVCMFLDKNLPNLTMTPLASQLISECRRLGIELSPTDRGVKCTAPVGTMTPELQAAIKINRDRIRELLLSDRGSSVRRPFVPAPIIPGEVHFSIWVNDVDGPLPEPIPGHHHDFRQPSRLRPLLASAHTFRSKEHETTSQDAPRIAPSDRVDPGHLPK